MISSMSLSSLVFLLPIMVFIILYDSSVNASSSSFSSPSSSGVVVPFITWSLASRFPDIHVKAEFISSDATLNDLMSSSLNTDVCKDANGNQNILWVEFLQSNVHPVDLAKSLDGYKPFKVIQEFLGASRYSVQVPYMGIDASKHIINRVTNECDNVIVVERPWNDLTEDFLNSLSNGPTVLKLQLPPFDTNGDDEQIVKSMRLVIEKSNTNGIFLYQGTLDDSAKVEALPLVLAQSSSLSTQATAATTTPFLDTYVIFTPTLFMAVLAAFLLVVFLSVGMLVGTH